MGTFIISQPWPWRSAGWIWQSRSGWWRQRKIRVLQPQGDSEFLVRDWWGKYRGLLQVTSHEPPDTVACGWISIVVKVGHHSHRNPCCDWEIRSIWEISDQDPSTNGLCWFTSLFQQIPPNSGFRISDFIREIPKKSRCHRSPKNHQWNRHSKPTTKSNKFHIDENHPKLHDLNPWWTSFSICVRTKILLQVKYNTFFYWPLW